MDSLGKKDQTGVPWAVAPANGDAAWSALLDDACAFVIVLTPLGDLVHASAGVKDLLAGVVGTTLEAAFGAEFAAERLGAMRRARESGRAVRLLGMMNGVLLTETYRGLKGAGDEAGLTLLTARPAGVESDFPNLMDGLTGGERTAARTNHLGHLASLTERELELLHHIGMGRTSDETAKLMHRSTRTVEWHRASLGQKLGCENRVQLARIAVRSGLSAVDVEFIRALHRSSVKPRA